MKFKDANLRFVELKKGDLAVCKLHCGNWNQIDTVLGIYWDGHFYDAYIKEDNAMLHEDWCLKYAEGGSMVSEYAFTGINVEDLESPVEI